MENENFTIQFAEGFKPVTSIGSNGNWFIDGADTGCSSIGAEGPEPVITIVNDNWYVDGVDTGIAATADLAEMEKELEETTALLNGRIDEAIKATEGDRITKLYTGTSLTTDSSITLSDSYKNYDFLCFTAAYKQYYVDLNSMSGTKFTIVVDMYNSSSTSTLKTMYVIFEIVSDTELKISSSYVVPKSVDETTTSVMLEVGTISTLKITGHNTMVAPSEITDARVDYKGTAHDTLGDAIRSQYQDLYDLIKDSGASPSLKADKISVEEETETTLELLPDTYYKFGTVESLSLTLSETNDTFLHEYMFEFTSGETATTLTLPDTVSWATDNTIDSNKKYQVSILNNVACMIGA